MSANEGPKANTANVSLRVGRKITWDAAKEQIVGDPDAARLMSIDVTMLVALTYAAAALLAGIGGILIAPLYNVAYDMGTLFGIKAFAEISREPTGNWLVAGEAGNGGGRIHAAQVCPSHLPAQWLSRRLCRSKGPIPPRLKRLH